MLVTLVPVIVDVAVVVEVTVVVVVRAEHTFDWASCSHRRCMCRHRLLPNVLHSLLPHELVAWSYEHG